MNEAKHIAIIMDGNGRWAELQGKQRIRGHEQGAKIVKEITTYCVNSTNIERLTLYAFSTENWKRPKLEVEFLMRLLDSYLKKELPTYLEFNTRFKAIGDVSGFSNKLQKTIKMIEEKTAHCDGLVQSLALNYGSQDEIVRAVKSLNEKDEEITAESISSALDCTQDVDLLIRTGGDYRLSNFLLWQAAYAELFFIDTLWPDFSSQHLIDIVKDFEGVERRFGGLK